jgi:hypothetical protein
MEKRKRTNNDLQNITQETLNRPTKTVGERMCSAPLVAPVMLL